MELVGRAKQCVSDENDKAFPIDKDLPNSRTQNLKLLLSYRQFYKENKQYNLERMIKWLQRNQS